MVYDAVLWNKTKKKNLFSFFIGRILFQLYYTICEWWTANAGILYEKEKYKENENDSKYVDEDKKYFNESLNNINKFKVLYEQNVGLINGIVAHWLIDISESIDYEMFKRAIEIATDKGKCNKGYISGILKQWSDNNIRTFKDLKAYEVGIRNRGVSDGKYKDEYRKSKYATELENEDESIYRKPTPEQLEEARRSFDELRKGK